MADRFARREMLRLGSAAFGAAIVSGFPEQALAAIGRDEFKSVAFHNLHTGERLTAEYWARGNYVPDALKAVNHVLRDYRNNEVHFIEPKLLDLLSALQKRLGSAAEVQVISGYRSPATNAAMHARSRGVASHSLHMEGKAIDIRLADVPLARLHSTALDLRAGGVGYYPTLDFVHVDVGRVRRWGG